MSKAARTLYALCLLISLVSAIRADTIDEFIRTEMKTQNIPGVSVAVIRDGKIIKAEGYGLANVELDVPATAETVYKIGSVSKQFIAAGILLLIQEKKVDLNDKISKFIGTPDAWKDITIRHLLTHTSGIVREAPAFDPFKIQSDADVIKSAFPLPLRFSPGERFEYSNTGYFILAEIISKAAQKSWAQYLDERLFTPLGMSSTRPTSASALVLKRSGGYVRVDNKLQNASDYLAVRPSGAFLSSIRDLAKWDAALYSNSILNQSTKDQMWSPVALNNGAAHQYGFGWYLETIGNHKAVRHGGSLPGFRAEFLRFTTDRLSVIILANGDNADLGPFALGIANNYIRGLIPQRSSIKVGQEILESYTGKYQPNPGTFLIVTREGDKLWLEGSNTEKRELLAETEVSFFSPTRPRLTFTFVKDENGSVSHMSLRADGREVGRAPKIE